MHAVGIEPLDGVIPPKPTPHHHHPDCVGRGVEDERQAVRRVKNRQTRLAHAAICLFGLQRRIRLYI